MEYDESRLRELRGLIKQFGAIVEANDARSTFRATRETIRQIQRVAKELQLPYHPVSWIDGENDEAFMIRFDAPFGDRDSHCAFLGVKADSKVGRDLKSVSSHRAGQAFTASSADAPYRFPRPAEAHRFASQTARIWLAVIDNWIAGPEAYPFKDAPGDVEPDRVDSLTESDTAQFLGIEIKENAVSRKAKTVSFVRSPKQLELLKLTIDAGSSGRHIDQLMNVLYPEYPERGSQDTLRKLQQDANKRLLPLRVEIKTDGHSVFRLRSV